MNHEQYREWLVLSIYEELDPLQKESLEEHLWECGSCRSELEELKKFSEILSHRTDVGADETLLHDARRQFRMALVAERSRRSLPGRLRDLFEFRAGRPAAVVLTAAALFAVGIVVGYRLVPQPAQETTSIGQSVLEQASDLQSGARVVNLRFADGGTGNGAVDLTFDAVVPMHVKGSPSDPAIQRILASALMNSQNPGVRFQTANMLASRKVSAVTADADVRDALITALETDENPGVRKEALAGLRKFPFDNEIKRAYMRVLMKDKNSGLRIDVINALTRVQSEGVRLDSDVVSVLQQKQQSDENEYIRTRATTLLQGVQQ